MSSEYIYKSCEKVIVNFPEPFKGQFLENCHYGIYQDDYRKYADSWHFIEEYNFDEMVSYNYFVLTQHDGDGPCHLRVSEDGALCVVSDYDGSLVKTHSPGDPVHNVYKDYLESKRCDDSDD